MKKDLWPGERINLLLKIFTMVGPAPLLSPLAFPLPPLSLLTAPRLACFQVLDKDQVMALMSEIQTDFLARVTALPEEPSNQGGFFTPRTVRTHSPLQCVYLFFFVSPSTAALLHLMLTTVRSLCLCNSSPLMQINLIRWSNSRRVPRRGSQSCSARLR